MAGAVRSKATLEEFLAIPEDRRFHELVDGDGYVVVVRAGRGERVKAEPFDAIELAVNDLLGGE